MKIATMYRKDGKVILETDNDAIAQVAADAPQDVVVMDARLVGRPPALAAPYGKEVPPSPHADHGRGTPEDGPEDCDCPCRSTPDQGACAAAGCGFCANVQPQGIAGPSPTLEAFADRIDAAIRGRAMAEHQLWAKGDPGLPTVLTDRNGDVVLGMCRVCGQAEAELEDTCPGYEWPEGARALAGEIAAAVFADESGEGCDISAGLFGPAFSALIRRLARQSSIDLGEPLADHARLQADAQRLDWLEDFARHAYMYGVSFDWAKPCEGEPGGFRFMTRHRLDARQPTLRAAIDAAKAVQP